MDDDYDTLYGIYATATSATQAVVSGPFTKNEAEALCKELNFNAERSGNGHPFNLALYGRPDLIRVTAALATAVNAMSPLQ